MIKREWVVRVMGRNFPKGLDGGVEFEVVIVIDSRAIEGIRRAQRWHAGVCSPPLQREDDNQTEQENTPPNDGSRIGAESNPHKNQPASVYPIRRLAKAREKLYESAIANALTPAATPDFEA